MFARILIHTATMRLHEITMSRARRRDTPDAALAAGQSKRGVLAAAAEIVSVFCSAGDLTAAPKNPIQDFAAYIAALAFLENFAVAGDAQSRGSVVFFVDMLQALGRSNAVAGIFADQLLAESRRFGIHGTESGAASVPFPAD